MNRDSAEHYSWGQGCDGWHLAKSPGLSVIQERMPPRTAEAPHHHVRSRQFFFVLAGTLTIEADGTRHVLKDRDGLEVPPGVKHQVTNASDSDVEFLVISQPPSHGDRVTGVQVATES